MRRVYHFAFVVIIRIFPAFVNWTIAACSCSNKVPALDSGCVYSFRLLLLPVRPMTRTCPNKFVLQQLLIRDILTSTLRRNSSHLFTSARQCWSVQQRHQYNRLPDCSQAAVIVSKQSCSNPFIFFYICSHLFVLHSFLEEPTGFDETPTKRIPPFT